jgi:hypothetical protein
VFHRSLHVFLEHVDTDALSRDKLVLRDAAFRSVARGKQEVERLHLQDQLLVGQFLHSSLRSLISLTWRARRASLVGDLRYR